MSKKGKGPLEQFIRDYYKLSCDLEFQRELYLKLAQPPSTLPVARTISPMRNKHIKSFKNTAFYLAARNIVASIFKAAHSYRTGPATQHKSGT
ncbi:hypothetical protein Mapa_016663 [Marchantia paleacea]|nr:hypothetical protein Mapa_016663 [Marchantia paleacea]